MSTVSKLHSLILPNWKYSPLVFFMLILLILLAFNSQESSFNPKNNRCKFWKRAASKYTDLRAVKNYRYCYR